MDRRPTLTEGFRALICFSLFLPIFGGCVNIEKDAKPVSWQVAPAAGVADFEGVFHNRSLDPGTGEVNPLGSQLCDFLFGRSEPRSSRDSLLRITYVPETVSLRIELFDDSGREVQFGLLEGGRDFEMVEGHLKLRDPRGETRWEAGNMAAGVGRENVALYYATSGDLLGRKDGTAAGLLFYVVPTVGFGTDWMVWRRATSADLESRQLHK